MESSGGRGAGRSDREQWPVRGCCVILLRDPAVCYGTRHLGGQLQGVFPPAFPLLLSAVGALQLLISKKMGTNLIFLSFMLCMESFNCL